MPCPRPIPLPMLPQLALLCVRTGVQDEDDDHGRTVPPLDHVSSRGATVDSHNHKGRAGANPVAHACAHGCGGVCDTHSQQHVVTAILVRALRRVSNFMSAGEGA